MQHSAAGGLLTSPSRRRCSRHRLRRQLCHPAGVGGDRVGITALGIRGDSHADLAVQAISCWLCGPKDRLILDYAGDTSGATVISVW